jgi:hypothetical protein
MDCREIYSGALTFESRMRVAMDRALLTPKTGQGVLWRLQTPVAQHRADRWRQRRSLLRLLPVQVCSAARPRRLGAAARRGKPPELKFPAAAPQLHVGVPTG